MNDANTKVEVNTNAKVKANEKQGFDMPLFAMPGIFRGIAEQGVVRADRIVAMLAPGME